jgi:hypothetical protein
MLVIYIFAGLLLLFAIIILVKNSSIHLRGALLAGTIALWLWGMAFALADYVKHCRLMSFGVGDPAAAAQALADSLVLCTVINQVSVPLMILCAIIFFIHQPRDVVKPANLPL